MSYSDDELKIGDIAEEDDDDLDLDTDLKDPLLDDDMIPLEDEDEPEAFAGLDGSVY